MTGTLVVRETERAGRWVARRGSRDGREEEGRDEPGVKINLINSGRLDVIIHRGSGRSGQDKDGPDKRQVGGPAAQPGNPTSDDDRPIE